MKVYHFISEKYCLQSLVEQRLKLSTLDDLNDPFELLSIDFTDRSLRPIFNKLKKRIADRIAMICFSKNWNEPLLWSHYADRHKGCVLEFNIDDSKLVEVIYQKNRVSIPKQNILSKNFIGFETKLFSTKYEGWHYEDEVRLFLEKNKLTKSGNLYFNDFSLDFFPSSIIIGPLSKLDISTIKKKLPTGRTIKFVKSRLAFRSFKVVRDKSMKPIILTGNA
jgi:Protein of unknown function (DUF2971)